MFRSNGVAVLQLARSDEATVTPFDRNIHQAVSIPDGWKILTNFWQPMRYVPSSREVRQYAHREAVKTMLELGITTPAQAQRLLESNDE